MQKGWGEGNPRERKRIKIETQENESLDLLLHEVLASRSEYYNNQDPLVKAKSLGRYEALYEMYQILCIKYEVQPRRDLM